MPELFEWDRDAYKRSPCPPGCMERGHLLTGHPREAFHDLPAGKFPFRVEAMRSDTKEVVWEQTIEAPGALHVPPLARRYGVPVVVRMTFADGEVVEEGGGDVPAR